VGGKRYACSPTATAAGYVRPEGRQLVSL